jgi:2-iminobutanoate/2-iminopropanoate deaminase
MTEAGITAVNPSVLPPPTTTFTHGALVTGAKRTLYVSGQVPWSDENGKVPEDFPTQARVTYANLLSVLAEAGMTVQNLAKLTVYLSDRAYRQPHGEVLEEVLQGHRPAFTSIITAIYSEVWLLEVDAIAVEF